MAVYTDLGLDRLRSIVAAYDIGELISAKGIAEGVSNSNWLIETRGMPAGRTARFILTMYERRIDLADLPFFLGLLDHLSQKGCQVPRTIHDRDGAPFRVVDGKAIALIEYRDGVSPDNPTPAQAHAIGAALANIHLAALDWPMVRANALGPEAWYRMLRECGADRLETIDPAMPPLIETAGQLVAHWPEGLPRSTIHSDLFPDNALFLGDEVCAVIDFYFACTDSMAYDLAVAHAAWSFVPDGSRYESGVGRALMAGYESVRLLDDDERAALPLLAQGAAMRFIASRAADWIELAVPGTVKRKDPMAFTRRLHFYRDTGHGAFSN